MTTPKTIDVETVPPTQPGGEPTSTQAVALRQPQGGEVAAALPPEQIQGRPPITAAQAKVDAVAALTMSAYQKAATLQISDEEIAKLQAEFPDDAFQPGAAGKEHLIYIQHAHLRDRLNAVFRPGQWSIVPRNRWAEPFKTSQGKEGSRVYVEAMLVIRGAFVAEAIGEMEYFPHNPSQNYGDAVEGAKTAALRRCCKELGVGLQAWKKEWCEGWWQRNPRGRPQPSQPPSQRPQPPAGSQSAPGAAQAPATPRPAPSAPPAAPSVESRNKLITQLKAGPGQDGRNIVTEFFRKASVPGSTTSPLMPTEEVEDLPLRFVPSTAGQFKALVAAIGAFEAGEEATLPYKAGLEPLQPKEPAKGKEAQQELPQQPTAAPKPVEVPRDANLDPNSPEAAWRSFPVPFGKDAGTKLADLDKKTLFGWWANFAVEETYQGRPRPADKLAKDKAFREMLNEAGKRYNFEKKD